MVSVGVRELRQHASRVLARVKNGETVEVTERGRPVARIVPLGLTAWEDMVASGAVSLPSVPGSLLDELPVDDGGPSLAEELARLREHER
jgi:prevent-host-death family protein